MHDIVLKYITKYEMILENMSFVYSPIYSVV